MTTAWRRSSIETSLSSVRATLAMLLAAGIPDWRYDAGMSLERLTTDELRRVRALRAAEGQAKAARLLTLAEVTLEHLCGGQPVLPATALRVRTALAKLDAG